MKKHYILIIVLFTFLQNVYTQIEVIIELNVPARMSLNGNDLYFEHPSKVSKINITEATPTITDVITNLDEPNGFATIFVGNNLYFTQTISDKISLIDITDSSPTIVDVISDGIDFPNDFLLSGDDLYFCQTSPGKISKIDITDATPTVVDVVSGLNLPNGMALNGNDLYIAELSAGKISKIDITQTIPATVDVITDLDGPISLALSNNDLYIAEINGNKISKIDITEIIPVLEDVIIGLNEPIDLVFHNSDLYFSERAGGRISKLENVALSINESLSNSKVSIYPNPSSDFIHVSGLTKRVNYKIYNAIGAQVLEGTLLGDEQINIENLDVNMYFLIFENGNSIKFIKE